MDLNETQWKEHRTHGGTGWHLIKLTERKCSVVNNGYRHYLRDHYTIATVMRASFLPKIDNKAFRVTIINSNAKVVGFDDVNEAMRYCEVVAKFIN